MVGIWLEKPKLHLGDSISDLWYGGHAIREPPAFLI
jgi:hypothetical protein